MLLAVSRAALRQCCAQHDLGAVHFLAIRAWVHCECGCKWILRIGASLLYCVECGIQCKVYDHTGRWADDSDWLANASMIERTTQLQRSLHHVDI